MSLLFSCLLWENLVLLLEGCWERKMLSVGTDLSCGTPQHRHFSNGIWFLFPCSLQVTSRADGDKPILW